MKKIYLVLFVILSIFVFSCKDNLISSDLSSSQNSGAGRVKVFVKQSRLIGPDVSDVDWTVELYKENDKISGKNENGYYLFSGLSDGTYDIKVSGKIDDVEKFTGFAQVTITNGNSVSVNVPIVAQKGTAEDVGTGYATITMDMSEELLSLLNSMVEEPYFSSVLVAGNYYYMASLVETSTDEQGDIVSIEFLDNQKVKFVNTSTTESYEIPTGYYCLTFSGLDSFTIKLKDDLVEIGDGLTTNIVLTQDDYELVYNSEQTYYVNNTGDETNNGLTLSSPIAYTSLPEDIGVVFLLEDVEGPSTFLYNYDLISSFGSKIFTITNPVSEGNSFSPSLKNIKIAGDYSINLNSSIYDTVILDIPVVSSENGDSCVYVSKSSNLRIGQNFSGELGIYLSSENWQLGDTVITFENGVKPSNSNFYISEDYDMPTGFASMFYIDDKGKLAQYDATSQWVNFAWDGECPYLITQTQAKNKTMTTILNESSSISNFTGVSTYDHENNTWYFIGGDSAKTLYSVKSPEGYESSVDAIDTDLSVIIDINASVKAMSYNNGCLYLLCNFNGDFEIYKVSEGECNYLSTLKINLLDGSVSDLTALLVYEDNFYIATDYIENSATTGTTTTTTTHSAIWKYKLEKDDAGVSSLTPEYTYFEEEYSVPYYLTKNDNYLKINDTFPENSTFRITDLYTDGTDIYGLLANYKDVTPPDTNVGEADVYMRGSVFKLVENSSRADNSSDPIMNATHLGLRKSFPLKSDDLATAKQYFILPRKIVGILNKKLVIVDDGMVPDSNDCNVDRFVLFDLFDLADEISETIDVAVPFSTNGVANTSESRFYTSNSLFN